MAAIANIYSLKRPKYWEITITSMFDGLDVLFLGKQFMHCGLRSSQSWPHTILGMTAKLWCSVVYHMPLTSTTGTQFIEFGNKRSQTNNLARSSLNISPVQANSQWRDPTKPYITVFTSASDHWNLSAPSKLNRQCQFCCNTASFKLSSFLLSPSCDLFLALLPINWWASISSNSLIR